MGQSAWISVGPDIFERIGFAAGAYSVTCGRRKTWVCTIALSLRLAKMELLFCTDSHRQTLSYEDDITCLGLFDMGESAKRMSLALVSRRQNSTGHCSHAGAFLLCWLMSLNLYSRVRCQMGE